MEIDNELLTETKRIIRSILISCNSKITVRQLCMDYKDLNGVDIPFREFGYNTVGDFIKNIPDVVNVEWMPSITDFGLSAVTDETTQHIEKLVQNQKKPEKSRVSPRYISTYRKPSHFSSFSNISKSKNVPIYSKFKSLHNVKRILRNELRNLIPVKIKYQIRELLECHKGCLCLKDFKSEFKTRFGKDFPFKTLGYRTLKECLMCIPDVKLEFDGNLWVVKFRNFDDKTENILATSRKSLDHESTSELKSELNYAIFENAKISNNNFKIDENNDICNFEMFQNSNKKLNKCAILKNEPNDNSNLNYISNDCSLLSKIKILGNCSSDGNFLEYKSKVIQKDEFFDKTSDSLFDKKINYKYESPTISKFKILNWRKANENTLNFQKFSESSEQLDSFMQQEFKNLKFENKKHNVISDEIKNEFQRVLSFYPDGIWASDFLKEYSKITRKQLILSEYGFDIMELIYSFPEIFKIKKFNDNKDDCLLFVSDELKTSNYDKSKSCSHIYKINSNFDDSLKANVINMLRYLKKIPLENFEKMYKIKFQTEIPWSSLGYNSMESFMFDLSDILPINLSFEGCTLFISLNLELCQSKETINTSDLSKKIPSDSVLPGETYSTQLLPDDLTHFIPIYVSQIYNPHKFWIQLRGESTSDALEILMEKLQTVYESTQSNMYMMPDYYFSVNNICAALWPDNNSWHRSIITKILHNGYVEVLYVDYGTKLNVPKQFLRFLKKEFLILPSQAIKGRLTNIQPINKTEWCEKANQRFMELCIEKPLVAFISNICFRDRISICLCDVSGDQDIHINDILIKENLAIFVIDPFHNQALKSDSYLNSSSCTASNDFGEIFQENEEFYDELCQAIEQFDFSITRIFLEEDYVIHLIILNEKPYVSSGDIASLFKKSENLEKMLLRKKVLIPYIVIEKSDNERLFSEMNKYEVKGIEQTSNRIILYPFEYLNKILIYLEHPSEDLKNDIKLEIKHFKNKTDLTEISLDELKTTIQYENRKREKIIQKMLNSDICDTYVEEVKQIENKLKELILKTKDLQKGKK